MGQVQVDAQIATPKGSEVLVAANDVATPAPASTATAAPAPSAAAPAPVENSTTAALPSSTKLANGAIINAPEPGVTEVVSVDPNQPIEFNFKLEDVKITLSDVDLVLEFENGARMIFVGLGVDLMASPAMSFLFGTTQLSKADIISKLGTFQETEVEQVFNAASSIGQQAQQQQQQQQPQQQQTP
ncbi:MAG: hypothetical protein ACRCT6_11585, partial [Notoacmeibacter sp.]